MAALFAAVISMQLRPARVFRCESSPVGLYLELKSGSACKCFCGGGGGGGVLTVTAPPVLSDQSSDVSLTPRGAESESRLCLRAVVPEQRKLFHKTIMG